ncbi:MAG: alanine dehydrogenase [Chloroflexi bacterium]|nr:alanine dehydrogenase [Chloroflexota bacterium]
MIIGVPKEVKDSEYRVAMTPGGVKHLVDHGHAVLVQSMAGDGSGFSDADFAYVGATIVPTAADAWSADLVVKVKEPQASEYGFLRPHLTLFTYLHLAAAETLTRALQESKVMGVAYETVELDNGQLPLLTPMSEVAGRMSVQVGAYYLERMNGGRGKLLGGVPGVRPCDVVIIGGGMVGSNAAQIALGMGASVVIIDLNNERLRYLDEVYHGRLTTLSSNPLTIAEAVKRADLLIGAVLVKGAKAPRLVTREMIGTMKPGSVVVDVAVDQGGCIETSHPTTHSNPTFEVDGVIHYCVSNMPGAVPRTSTYALSNSTLPYILRLANHGVMASVGADGALAKGVNTCQGHITYAAVAEAFDLDYTPLADLL